MTFARWTFRIAGLWGLSILTPFYFLFDRLGAGHAPQSYFGFLAVTMAWQVGFLVIATDPARFRPLMVPAMIEKFGYVATILVLYLQHRATPADLATIVPDLLLGVLFALSFVKTQLNVVAQGQGNVE